MATGTSPVSMFFIFHSPDRFPAWINPKSELHSHVGSIFRGIMLTVPVEQTTWERLKALHWTSRPECSLHMPLKALTPLATESAAPSIAVPAGLIPSASSPRFLPTPKTLMLRV